MKIPQLRDRDILLGLAAVWGLSLLLFAVGAALEGFHIIDILRRR